MRFLMSHDKTDIRVGDPGLRGKTTRWVLFEA
jgi:hypothetical protein